jgi:hypothetical protein
MKIGLAALAFSFVWLLACSLVIAADKTTSLSDAQAAIEANLRTAEGKAFDKRVGTEFEQKHVAPLRQCKASAGNDLGSFWILLKLDKDGLVEEVLLYPSTKLGACARDAYLKNKFPAPPHADYWVGVYLNLSH